MIFKIPMIGQNGLMNDLPLSDMPPNVITFAQNVRCRDGLIELVYGHTELSNGTSTDFAPYFTIYNGDSATGYWLLAGLNKIYCSQRGETPWTDISRVSGGNYGATADARWVGGVMNGVVIITNGIDIPQLWAAPTSTTKMVALPYWTSTHLCKSIRPFKNYWIALNITKGSNYYPHMVKWSHPAEPGTWPASWDETDATIDAGEVDLPGADHIVDGGALQDFFVIYKERSTHVMQYIGGRYIFRFFPVLAESGIMGRDCWTELNGKHIVFTASDLISHDGFQAESLLNGKMRRWLFSDIDAGNSKRSFLVKQWFFNELWLCYPEAGETTCTKALVWNWKDNAISVRDLPYITHAASGPTSDVVGSSWDVDTAPWSSDPASWNSNELTPALQRVVMVSPGTKQFIQADSTSRFFGEIIPAELIRGGLTFDAPETRKLVRSVRPRIKGTGNSVLIQLGGQEHLHGPVNWGPEQTFTIDEQYKTDHLTEGRYITLRIASNSDLWRLESLDMDIEMLGEY